MLALSRRLAADGVKSAARETAPLKPNIARKSSGICTTGTSGAVRWTAPTTFDVSSRAPTVVLDIPSVPKTEVQALNQKIRRPLAQRLRDWIFVTRLILCGIGVLVLAIGLIYLGVRTHNWLKNSVFFHPLDHVNDFLALCASRFESPHFLQLIDKFMSTTSSHLQEVASLAGSRMNRTLVPSATQAYTRLLIARGVNATEDIDWHVSNAFLEML